jgi:hypothetical protein
LLIAKNKNTLGITGYRFPDSLHSCGTSSTVWVKGFVKTPSIPLYKRGRIKSLFHSLKGGKDYLLVLT